MTCLVSTLPPDTVPSPSFTRLLCSLTLRESQAVSATARRGTDMTASRRPSNKPAASMDWNSFALVSTRMSRPGSAFSAATAGWDRFGQGYLIS